VQEIAAATPRQTKKNNPKPKSKRPQLPSCGAVETATPTQREVKQNKAV